MGKHGKVKGKGEIEILWAQMAQVKCLAQVGASSAAVSLTPARNQNYSQ